MTPDPGSSQAVVDAVRAAAHAYEAALVAGDVAAATAMFDTSADVSRFGPDGVQIGPDAVAAARATYAPQPEPEWLLDDVRVLGPDVALHLAVLMRGGTTVQRTQVWRLESTGWKVAHAHVSRIDGVSTVQR